MSEDTCLGPFEVIVMLPLAPPDSALAPQTPVFTPLREEAPPPGKFRVTIRVECPDGQFATSSRLIPGDLLMRPEPDSAQEIIMENISDAFVGTYRRAAELLARRNR